jgi:8-oxo-dGTP pyrophosphatase MutT (NUDIX family)
MVEVDTIQRNEAYKAYSDEFYAYSPPNLLALFQPVTRGVRAILVNDMGEVFLVRHAYGTGWYLPGGRVKRGEDDLAALHREMQEEAGIKFGTPKK